MRLPRHAPTQAHLPGCLFVHLYVCLACLFLALRTMSQLLPAGCFVVVLSVVQDKLNPFSVCLLDSLLQMGLHYSVLYDSSTVNLRRLASRILVGWGGGGSIKKGSIHIPLVSVRGLGCINYSLYLSVTQMQPCKCRLGSISVASVNRHPEVLWRRQDI